MASHHGNTYSDRAKMEQIITEFFAKSLHIILESRCPYVSSRNYSGEQVLSSPSPSSSSSSSSSSFRPRDKWFNLALRECPAALENIDFWRQSNLEPMIVDVILMRRPKHSDQLNFSPKRRFGLDSSGKEAHNYGSDNDESWCEAKNGKIIERWFLQYECKKGGANVGGSSGSKRSSCTSSQSLYRKSILLLRSLYATVRLLPAYKLFRDLISSAQLRLYNLGHRVSSFVEPFTSREEADMQRFVFTPLDTSCGRLSLSVLYRSSVVDVSCEPSTPISPQFIPEYVGSPMAEPLKRFPSGPAPQSSPSSCPFTRRHSWSYDLFRASPPSAIPSPSPTYSESHASFSKHQPPHLPPTGLPRPFHDETPAAHMKNPSYEDYLPFPMFSRSPTPSPPTYVAGNHISGALLRCESAPVSIPASKLSSTPSLPNNQLVHPSPPLKATRLTFPKQGANMGLHQTGSRVEKLLSLVKDETQKLGVKPSSDSPSSKSFSRTSSRLSFQDDYDESDFCGAFIIDDDNTPDPGSRQGSDDLPGHLPGSHEDGGNIPAKKSQDAAVAALFNMLKRAPPLSRDISQGLQDSRSQTLKTCLQSPIVSQESTSSKLTSTGLMASTTMADALKELQGYTKMKDSLLKEGKLSPS